MGSWAGKQKTYASTSLLGEVGLSSYHSPGALGRGPVDFVAHSPALQAAGVTLRYRTLPHHDAPVSALGGESVVPWGAGVGGVAVIASDGNPMHPPTWLQVRRGGGPDPDTGPYAYLPLVLDGQPALVTRQRFRELGLEEVQQVVRFRADTTGDGKADTTIAVGVDTTGDGTVDTTIAIKPSAVETGVAFADARQLAVVASDRGPRAKAAKPHGVDSSRDGKTDLVLLDTTRDGQFDAVVRAAEAPLSALAADARRPTAGGGRGRLPALLGRARGALRGAHVEPLHAQGGRAAAVDERVATRDRKRRSGRCPSGSSRSGSCASRTRRSGAASPRRATRCAASRAGPSRSGPARACRPRCAAS